MNAEANLERRRQKAARMLLESEIVTSALEDHEAEVLLDWALAQVERYAVSSKDLGDEEADERIAMGVGKVRRLMKKVAGLVEEKDELSSLDIVERLTNLLAVSME